MPTGRHIFLAFALDKKNKLDESEQAYLDATSLKENESQGWQGLIQLYRDFCLNDLETCQECALPRLVARVERLRRGIPPEGL